MRVEENESSVEQDVAAVMEAIDGAPAEAEPAESAPKEPTERPIDAGPEEAEAKAARERDEGGRFKAKAKAEEVAEKPAAVAKPAQVAVKGPPAAEAPKPAPVAKFKPPASWKPTERERFGELPDWVQEIIDRREREIQQGLQAAAEPRKFYEGYKQRLGAHESFLKSLAPEPLQAMESLVQMAQTLRMGSAADKARVAYQLLTENGVDIDAVNAHLSGKAAPQGPVDINTIKAQLREEFQADMQRQQQEQQREHVRKTWEDFSSQHEYATEMGKEIAGFVSAGYPLAEAYELAKEVHIKKATEVGEIWKRRAEIDRRKADTAKAEEAKKKSVSVKSSPSNIRPAKKSNGSVEDDIRAAMEELSG